MTSRLRADALSLQETGETTNRIVRFLKSHTARIGAKCLVVGMSGGLDSSVTAVLCSMAVGGRRTLGVSLMEADTENPSNLQDAQEITRKYSIQFKSLDITALVKNAAELVHVTSSVGRVPIGNIKARLRAMILYYFANTTGGIVVGTSDKSEIMLGYFTKYGDGACDVEPLADIYKTRVRDLAKYLRLPSKIYSKPSSPDLWRGQTAESELGLPYEKLDPILYGLERWIPPIDISTDLAVPLKTVKSIRERWLQAEHKRRPPLSMKLGYRTPSQDLRIPYSLSAY
jgi:NAD+ synthase